MSLVSLVSISIKQQSINSVVAGNFVDAAIWSAAEPSMGVIAACIPSLRPLFSMVFKGRPGGPTMASKSAQATTSSGSSRIMWPVRSPGDEPVGGFTRLEDGQDRWGHNANIHGGKHKGHTGSDEISLEEMGSPSKGKGIRVKNEVTVTSEAWDYKDRLY